MGNPQSNMEKGFGARTTVETVITAGDGGGTPPKSTFDMDSPLEEHGRRWPKIFGRR